MDNKRLLALAVPFVLFVSGTAVIPRHIAGAGGEELYRGEVEAQRPLAETMASWATDADRAEVDVHGGNQFDAEWRLVSCQMTVLGLGQVVNEHPELRDAFVPAMEECLEWMISPEALAFGADRWGESGTAIEELTPHAYLGYVNVALSMYRLVAENSRFAQLNDRLTDALAQRLSDVSFSKMQTYPGETFPADIATVVASIALHATATGRTGHRDTLAQWLETFRAEAVDQETGLAVQSLSPTSGAVVNGPRASGTAFTAYFLAFADIETSKALWTALRRHCFGTTLGFGGIDEYPAGATGGFGDVDSGPVLFGVGTSATGFALAAARIHGDEDAYISLARTATLIGAPRSRDGTRRYLTGGSIGNALLLAMLTAHPMEKR